ncbi:hypothetical protein MUO93_11685, partial [Candidatus Bathyarchaeota archaeon]|nr:hypothetical protein [Candidatus Bathyarchaeota archaeon]
PIPPGVRPEERGLEPNMSLPSFLDRFFDDWRKVTLTLGVAAVVMAYSFLMVPPPIVSFPKPPDTWDQPVPEQNYTQPETLQWSPRYEKKIVFEEDTVLNGSRTLVLENCSCAFNGFLLVKDDASLILRNADVFVRKKSGWTSLDIVPFPYYFAFMNSSSLEAYNSTIFFQGRGEIGFFDSGSGFMDSCQMHTASFDAHDDSRLQFNNCSANTLGTFGNSSIAVRDSSVETINSIYTMCNWRQPVIFSNASVDVYSSKIGELQLKARNSKIVLDKPIKGFFSHWDPNVDLCSGGESLNIVLQDSELLSQPRLWFVNCTVEAQDQRDLGTMIVESGSLTFIDSTCTELTVVRCREAEVTDSLIYLLHIDEEVDAVIRRTKAKYLTFIDADGVLEFDQVKATRLFVFSSATTLNPVEWYCRVKGSLLIENNTSYDFSGKFKIVRSYDVVAVKGDRACPGVKLTLKDGNGNLVWEGKTDGDGRGSFNLTLVKLWKTEKYVFVTNVTDSYSLEAVTDGIKSNATVNILAQTPIIFSFPSEPQKPLWAENWFLTAASSMTILVVSGGFLFRRLITRRQRQYSIESR